MYERIRPDEINALPLIAFEGEIALIETKEDGDNAVKEILKGDSILGFDTESKPVFKKGIIQRLALIQLSNGNKTWLFRVLKCGIPDTLAQLLSDESILKIGLAITDDGKKIHHDFGITTKGLLDISTLSNECGYIENGLRNLTARVLGYRISKAQQTSNWEAEELSEAQQIYAATDAWLGRELYQTLLNEKLAGDYSEV
ncbi:MAG: 3'-5' exonuclease [Bacteroidota bacterium]